MTQMTLAEYKAQAAADERAFLAAVLAEHEHNISRAAKTLDISRSRLGHLLKRLGLAEQVSRAGPGRGRPPANR